MYDTVNNYENYHEEDRLSSNNARKVEFITTIRVFGEIFPSCAKILDCAAGTGIYAFHYAQKGYDITATDITPRHIEYINEELKHKAYHMNTAVLDAADLSLYADETFDIVLCMGPFYHITDKTMRDKCLSECIRVTKKCGLVAVSYISRFYIFPLVATSDVNYMTAGFAEKIMGSGALPHNDPDCFWTDSYFATPEKMEESFQHSSLQIVDHFAQDGITPMLRQSIDELDVEKFNIWCDYHYSVCRERSILGSSNHGVIIGRK